MALKGPLYSKGSTHCTQRPSVTGTAHSCPVLVTANAHKHTWFCLNWQEGHHFDKVAFFTYFFSYFFDVF